LHEPGGKVEVLNTIPTVRQANPGPELEISLKKDSRRRGKGETSVMHD